MTISNLSKIKPQLRTKGNITGNFGKQKVKGAYNQDLGFTTKDDVSIPTQDEYLSRLYDAFNHTEDEKLKKFLYTQIRNILIQRNLWWSHFLTLYLLWLTLIFILSKRTIATWL